jgi:hypothetical protein
MDGFVEENSLLKWTGVHLFATSAEELDNACRSLYSAIVVNYPEKIITINTKPTRF